MLSLEQCPFQEPMHFTDRYLPDSASSLCLEDGEGLLTLEDTRLSREL